MKKTISLLAALLLVLTVAVLPVVAEGEEAITVYVNLSNAGELVIAHEAIAVTDVDGDGTLTIQDVMILAHDAKFEGGAAEGFAAVDSDYGPMITKMWGVENGGSYGYYLNNNMAYSLLDPVAEGDCLTAYVFADTATFSDVYTYFEVSEVQGMVGEELTLTLYQVGFDANYAPVSSPLSGVSITVDGAEVAVTDENGVAAFAPAAEGTFVLSATSAELTLVPPVCILTVAAGEAVTEPEAPVTEPEAPATEPEVPAAEPEAPSTEPDEPAPAEESNNGMLIVIIALVVVAAVVVVVVMRNKKKANGQ